MYTKFSSGSNIFLECVHFWKICNSHLLENCLYLLVRVSRYLVLHVQCINDWYHHYTFTHAGFSVFIGIFWPWLHLISSLSPLIMVFSVSTYTSVTYMDYEGYRMVINILISCWIHTKKFTTLITTRDIKYRYRKLIGKIDKTVVVLLTI